MPKKKDIPVPSQTIHGGASGEIAAALVILAADRDVDNLTAAARARMDEISALQARVSELSADLAEARAIIDWQVEETSEPGSMRECIEMACNEMRNFLVAKNGSYGNSAADPVRVFSRADPLEQINVRLDDKLSRMMRGHGVPNDNDEQDLAGYLVLKQAVLRWLAIHQAPC